MTREERQVAFIEKANNTHKNKYDYSKVIYENTHSKVEIICKEHGSFFQTPASHSSGTGCPSCGGSIKRNNDTFIQKAKSVHGDKYDYSKVNYVNAHTKVTIGCHLHGDWDTLPCNHTTRKSGCPKCRNESNKLTTEEFIEKAKQVHGDKYDYSLVEYVNPQTRVEIICPVHGSFLQLPTVHRQSGSGCSSCAKFGIDRDAPTFIYAMEIIGPEGRWWWKGGVSIDPHRRAMQIERSMKNMGLNLHINVIDIVEIESGREAEKIETAMKEEENIREYTIEKFDGSTELFSSNPIKWAIDRGLINQKH